MSTISSSSRPSSPKKPGATLSDVFKPNPHPYAIKTTSTGILSRSSSTSSSTFQSQNHYVPVSPSPSPTATHYPSHSGRESRHRYSRSLTDENSPRPLPPPPEDMYYQQPQLGHVRQRSESLSEVIDDAMNPKSWTFEQLAANVPEIAGFVIEHEITGRAFLRFDDGVLDAYGVTQQWQRSLILSHSRQLRQSMLQNRIWPNSNPLSVSGSRSSHSRSLSPSKCGQPYEEDDPAYLSSSSSKSSASSLAGRKTRRHRPNGRVNGMIASFERSASPDKAEFQRDRSGSISSVEDNYPRTHSTGDSYGRPLPFPPPPAGDYLSGPLLLPQTSFPNSFPQSFDTRQPAGLSINTTPHVTGNGAFMATPQPTESPSRPLPVTPLHPSLRPPPVLSDDDSEDESAVAPGNKSGEMTMEELISVLNPDADTDTNTNTTDTHAFINTDRRRGRDNIDKRKNKGAAAWEVDVGETVKHAPANPVTEASQPHTAVADDELSVEELLALEGGPGAAAWVDQPKEAVQTMKRVGPDERENGRFGSISKGRSVGKASTERISLSAGRKSHGKGKTQARRVGELFSFPGGVKEERPGEEERKISTLMEDGQEAEERELERMRLVERELMCAEEEERQRWVRQAEEEAEVRRQEELRAEEAMAEIRRQEAVRAEEERIRQEERLRELFQRQKRMEEERQHQVAEEAAVKERQAQEEAAVERRRQLEAEERLALSIAENRRLLEEFRRRLEQVEQRIEEFQIAAPTSTTPDPQAEDSNERLVQRLRTITAWALSTPLGAALPAAVGHPLALFVKGDESTTAKSTTANSLRSADESASTSHRRHRQSKILAALYPKTFRRYTLLFGVGMCVFMLQGLMRWGVKGVQGIGAVGARGVRGR